MVFAGCMVIAQCGGSMLHDSDLKNEQWKQEQDICLYHKEDIIGTWVETNGMDDVLGITHSEEIFRADGSWLRTSRQGGRRTQGFCRHNFFARHQGRWRYIGCL